MTHETVLVTGANGYIGLHVLHQCLAKGWDVVAMVRSQRAAQRLQAIFPDVIASSRLEIAFVSDIVTPEQYEPAFKTQGKQITAVINIASPLISNAVDVRKEVLYPAIQSGTALLEALQRFGGGSVRRVVHTSSCAAVLNPLAGLAPGKTYTPEDWNPITYEQAAEGGHAMAYMASKALAEKAMWNWMTDHPTAKFDFVSIAPSATFGPAYFGAFDGVETLDLEHLNLSIQMLWVLISPSATPTPYNEPFHVGGCVDVRDVGRSLVASVDTPDAGGKRLIAAQTYHWQRIRDLARQALPELRHRIDVGEPGAAEAALEKAYHFDSSALAKILGVNYRPVEETLRDTFSQLLKAEQKM